jgi:hypothetical protein
VTKKRNSETKDVKVKPRTLLITSTDGEFKITIPAGARLTFGPTIPYEGRRQNGGYAPEPKGYSLRVYETAKTIASLPFLQACAISAISPSLMLSSWSARPGRAFGSQTKMAIPFKLT